MQAGEITILSTRPLHEGIVQEARSANTRIDCLSFIETESIRSEQLKQSIKEVLEKEATVVFTSMNAVEAVNEAKDEERPKWKIFCTGGKTKDLVAEYFGKENIASSAHSAEGLAEKISGSECGPEIIFFCGTKRREELPALLKEKGMIVREIEVYKTTPVSHWINRHYDGILFFSPSAVEAFFNLNRLEPGTVLFAIGETTAKTIKKFSGNPVIVAKEPDKTMLANEAILYFRNSPENLQGRNDET